MIINNNHENGRYLMKYSSCERKGSSQIINDTRKLQEQLIMESMQRFQSKSPKINSQYNQINISGYKKNDQILEKAFKQIEQIKHKHSQNFNDSHFSLERIGLNPKSFQCIVYKKQQNNCINPILEYINRNNIGIPQEIQYKSELKKSLISQKQKQMEEQQNHDDAQYYPAQQEAYSFIDNRRSKLQTRYKELKNIEQDQNEYSQQAYEQLKNILSPKKKNKQENELEHLKQHNQRYKEKYSKNLQKIQIKSQISSVASPNNQSPLRIFSPPKNIDFNNKSQVGKLNKNGLLNKSDIISSQSTHLQSQQQEAIQDKKNQKGGLQKKFEKKSDQLFDYLNNSKNPITVEGKIYVKDDNQNKQSRLRYSKDDLNKQDYEQNDDRQMRKHSTPIKVINDFKNNLNQNQTNNLNQKHSKQRYNKSQEIQHINKTEASQLTQQEQLQSQINTNFLNIQNLNQKIKQQNTSQIIDNQQFDDSFILNHQSQVKLKQNSVNIPTHSYEIIMSNKHSDVDPKNSQHNLNNQSVILRSIADCEEADIAVQQHEIEKQCKTNKYLSRLGLNNKYSKRDYLKVQNQSQVNKEFLNINFDSENLNPKSKNINQISSKVQCSSQKAGFNEKIYPQLGDQVFQNKKQRSFTTQFENNQHLNKQKCQEILPLNIKYISNSNQEVKNSQQSYQNYNLQHKNKSLQQQVAKDQTLFSQQNYFISPELSRNMSILQQCEKESKNINQLSKLWEKNIDKMVLEKNNYDQQYNNLQEQTITEGKTNIYQYYQKQRFNTDF
ncbi:hypothetical protein TTHERM_00009800 (macronuclear) [Tetrahymena thermophila SB210]|uniref:Uncharacterized protein n=1 Tax=Tetrahymena thermophila (strain SB210) TaxID=312017 RepID=Q22S53_TETTS|nr:hypothetical protein TTHERM_00009800 [Tetrahymena thermophila SB210]EAR87919.2 hypothetical protein TTHERM_00009800 [Tetrahymena thermophila SB210]|eukprot:XP_001008164.2 hypothetical protein TTHERM_00009800 [Tetrahymena thermophila SB210]